MATRIILVGCGKTKAAEACAARELYTGNLFRAAREHAEAEVAAGRAAAWFILSAKHGLVEPSAQVAPYDERLPASGAKTLRWGCDVLAALRERHGAELELVVLAGAPYVNPLRAADPELPLEDPMHGLEVGERLSWFKARRAERPVDMAKVQAEVDAWLQLRLEAAAKRRAEGQATARARRAADRKAAKEAARAAEEAKVAEQQKEQKAAERVYIGTDFDKELQVCPHCPGGGFVQGIALCFEPMGRLGKGRSRSLDAGTYHRVRVPADVLERADRAAEELRDRLAAYHREKDHEAALAKDLDRAHHQAILEEGRRGLAAIQASTDVAAAARAAGFSAQDAESLAEQRAELDAAHEEAIAEDERRRGRPELAVACPKCHAEQGRFCRDYRGKKKPTCRERPEAPGAVAAHERYLAHARAVASTVVTTGERPRAEVEAQLEAEARAAAKPDRSKVLCPKCNSPRGWHAGSACLDAKTYAILAEEEAALAKIPCPRCHAPAGVRCKSGIGCSERIRLVEEAIAAARAPAAPALELQVQEAPPAPRRDPAFAGFQLNLFQLSFA